MFFKLNYHCIFSEQYLGERLTKADEMFDTAESSLAETLQALKGNFIESVKTLFCHFICTQIFLISSNLLL